MSKKNQIIQAIKDWEFDELYNLLDDSKSYMNVPKDLFIEKLKERVTARNDIMESFSEVIELTSTHLKEGVKCYSFKSGTPITLDLCFEGNNDEVTDIYLSPLEAPSGKRDYRISFPFYEDVKVDFKPSSQYIIDSQNIETAHSELNSLTKDGYIYIEDLADWRNKYKHLGQEKYRFCPFARIDYKVYFEFDSLFYEIHSIVEFLFKDKTAKKALSEFRNIESTDEEMIVRWLLMYREKTIWPLEKTENWKKTGLIRLKKKPNVIVDCFEYLDALTFNELYNHHEDVILDKYEPTEEHYRQNSDGIAIDLETCLRLHNKYVELL